MSIFISEFQCKRQSSLHSHNHTWDIIIFPNPSVAAARTNAKTPNLVESRLNLLLITKRLGFFTESHSVYVKSSTGSEITILMQSGLSYMVLNNESEGSNFSLDQTEVTFSLFLTESWDYNHSLKIGFDRVIFSVTTLGLWRNQILFCISLYFFLHFVKTMKGRFLSKVFPQNAETQSTPDLHTVREVFSRGKCPKLVLLEVKNTAGQH